ncbi:heavy-metal-associated domain-containing protein [Burkholderia pseudomultivorans]|uniref:heavy-metal-associated domain-containing protein n=1 Tax=Burkholderia pseudomultivorans TaxID=1207504 RepID=UPI00188E93D8|nr:heavy-metal-associated domain-containing protein [Burkholderia pseudomultivorans]MBF5008695.1 heavy-metal-associated domain-containing protein [Burkholderia pseudomultivorans]
MDTIELKIKGMSCGSCVSSVTRALQQVPGVDTVDVNLELSTARVSGNAQAMPAMLAALAAAGYEAVPLGAGAGATHARHADAPADATRKSGGCCH